MTERTSQRTVMLVDDNPIVRKVFRDSLEDAGYVVTTLSSAFQVNAAIREQTPDLILLDVRMPGLPGDKAAAILKQRRFGSEIPILLFSDSDDGDLERRALESGAAGYIRKSPDHGPLLAAIARQIELSRESAVSPPMAAGGQ